MRNIYKKMEFEGKNLLDGVGDGVLGGNGRLGSKTHTQQELERRKTLLMKDGVGDLEEIGEFGLGIAPSMAKPVNKIEISK